MATGGLLSSRSRHSTKKRRLRHSEPSSRSKETDYDGDVEEVVKPDLDELRRTRTAYYSIPPEQRRRLSVSISVKGSVVSSVRTKSRVSIPSDKRNSQSGERRHRKRKHKNSTSSRIDNIEKDANERSEEYVYRSNPPKESESVTRETIKDDDRRQRLERKRSGHLSLSYRHSLPTVIETEITPDDSISQVAERTASDTHRRKAHVRPSLKRSSTTLSKLPPISESRKDATSVTSSKRSSKNDLAPLNSFARRHSTTSIPTPRMVDCLTCGSDDIPSTKSAKLACGHRMCHDCLKRIFEMSVKDPAHMPPKCCTEQHIPLDHVDKLFDIKFKLLWNRKYQEYHTKNRIYCPTLKCGAWIKPSHIHTDRGRKYAVCPRCTTKVCVLCNTPMHKSGDCPKDPEIAKLVEQAKAEGWQRCYRCNSLVEKKEGCNHMTCRCMAEFCIVCGSKWKTCECPLFSHMNIPDADRLNEWRVPEPIRVIFRQAGAFGVVPPPPAAAADAPNGQQPELTYRQEIDQRRRQERDDERLARRLQMASLWDPVDDGRPGGRGLNMDAWGFGNAAGHFMNDDFVQNAANVVMNAFGDTNLGRRGERQSGRRRRARQTEQNGDAGLSPEFLGDPSILGVGVAGNERTARR